MNDTTLNPLDPSGKKTGIKLISRKPPSRGFALHDWMRLLRSAKNISGRSRDGLRPISPDEVRRHNKAHDCWMSLHGKVYNIGPYLHYHPGGMEIMKESMGKDASILYDKYHRWVNAEGLIGPLLIGYLTDETKKENENNNVSNIRTSPPLPSNPDAGKIVNTFDMPPPIPIVRCNVPLLQPSEPKNESQ